MTSSGNSGGQWRIWRTAFLAAALGGLAVGSASAIGCATGTAEFDENDNNSSASSSSSGNGGATTSNLGGSGGATTSSTSSWPCGVDCSAIQVPDCQVAKCNTQTSQCEVLSAEDGSDCEDGLFCTINDTCLDGMCEAGDENKCGLVPEPCTEVTCDEQSKMCGSQASSNGASCTPADLCMVNGQCSNGSCIGTPKDCFFAPVPDDCHVAECNPMTGTCDPVPGNEGQTCTDVNDLCTVNKTCAAGVCTGGAPKDCSQLTKDCVLGVCDTMSGQCTTKSLNNGDPCDDLDGCTSGETCQAGQCTGGTPTVACVDNDNCCPQNCTPQNDKECAVVLLFDSLQNGSTGQSSRGPGSSCGTQVKIGGTNVNITKIAVRNDLTSNSGNLKFIILDHDGGHNAVYVSSPQAFTDSGSSWKESATFSYTLQANKSYCIGAIADASGTWQYDTTGSSLNGISSSSQNPNFSSYANPAYSSHGGADCGIQLYGYKP